ncbi:MAG: DNA-protecting protein DprA [Clostridiales bacterium]|nr:DNA-protecting protein DprA [Clostridiales bacterium]
MDLEIRKVTRQDPEYPALLQTIKNPPSALYYKGDLSPLQEPCLAIVGSRKASSYGSWAAYELARRAAAYGITVVSGMAYGIDAAAHTGALDGGGKTVAVFGCGVDICYPSSHRKLLGRILQQGAVLSEFQPGTKPHPAMFPVRNRIISGLCQGTVIAEAALKSGSLITAELAAEQGREVFAVPGNINQVYSFGTNKLIRDGAIPIVSFDDVLEIFGLDRRAEVKRKAPKPLLSPQEQRIADALRREGELSLNRLAEILQLPPGDLAAEVTYMEVKGLVSSQAGRIFLNE